MYFLFKYCLFHFLLFRNCFRGEFSWNNFYRFFSTCFSCFIFIFSHMCILSFLFCVHCDFQQIYAQCKHCFLSIFFMYLKLEQMHKIYYLLLVMDWVHLNSFLGCKQFLYKTTKYDRIIHSILMISSKLFLKILLVQMNFTFNGKFQKLSDAIDEQSELKRKTRLGLEICLICRFIQLT